MHTEKFQGDFSAAEIHILPERLAASDPAAVSAELVEWINNQEGLPSTIEMTAVDRDMKQSDEPRGHAPRAGGRSRTR